MAEIHHKKQQITAALTDLRIQMQNEMARLRRTLDMKQIILQSIKNHPWEWASCAALFRVASVALTRAEKENLYSQLESKVGQKP